MQCQTVRPGTECFFWKKAGCSHPGNTCYEITEQCGECANVVPQDERKFCTLYPKPEAKWALSTCTSATHIADEKPPEKVVKINPLKASKRAAGRK